MSVERSDELRLTGSGGANRVMEAELKRLVMRSPFQVRLEKPKREGEATLLYPFDARVAWVAACYHRTSSRISWDLCSSGAVRLEPLFADIVATLSLDERLPDGESLRFSVEVGPSQDFEASPLQLRGVVKNAIIQALASRGVTAELDAESPEVVFAVRRAGVSDEARRTVVGIDIGGGARHRRGARVVMGPAPLRETMAAQLIMLSRWDARTEPLVDPMAGGGTIPIEAAGLAVGAAIRRPVDLPLGHLTPFEDLPIQTPDLFPGTVPRILALDIDAARIPDMVGNLRAAGLTGPSHEKSIVIAQQDVRALDPDYVRHMLPGSRDMKPGAFCFNPPYGVRMGAEEGDDKLLALYSDIGRAFGRFKGWRAACFVANPRFVDAFGHRPALTKPASNGDLRGAFLVFDL
jgi:putative N6-adenine-specific DNA methylase